MVVNGEMMNQEQGLEDHIINKLIDQIQTHCSPKLIKKQDKIIQRLNG